MFRGESQNDLLNPQHGPQGKPRSVAEAVREEVIEPLAIRMDRVLPSAKPKYGLAEDTAKALQRPNYDTEVSRGINFVSYALDVIILATERKYKGRPLQSYVDRKDPRLDAEVVVHPLELTTLYRAMFLLSEVVKDTSTFLSVYDRATNARAMGVVDAAVYLLEVAYKLRILDDPSYRPLVSTLQEVVVTHPKFTSVEVLQRHYKGKTIEDTQFWTEAFENLTYIKFPDREILKHDKRVIANEVRSIRGETLNRAVRKTLTMGERPEDAIATLRGVTERKRQLYQDEEIVIRQEIKRWQETLSPLVKDISYYASVETKTYLKQAIAILVAHFIDRGDRAADKDVSRKEKKIFLELTTSQGDPHYQYQLDEFLETSLRDGDPIILWLLSFRNTISEQTLIRSIRKDPVRFIDLEKLILHQLSKYGLLQSKGERSVIFRRDTSLDDQTLLEQLPIVLSDFQRLADNYPSLHLDSHSAIDENFKRNVEVAYTGICREEAPLDQVLNNDNLTDVARQSAIDRLDQLKPKLQNTLDRAVINLRLKMGKYNRLLRNNWFSDLASLARIPRIPRYGFREIDKRNPTELKRNQLNQRGLLLYSSAKLKELDHLPLIRFGFKDDDLKHFLNDGGTSALKKNMSHGGFEERPLEQAIELSEQEGADFIYIVDLPSDAKELPIFSDHRLRKAWYVGRNIESGEASYLIAVSKVSQDSISDRIKKSTIVTERYNPYSLVDTFNFDEAAAYNSTLSKDAALQKLHKDFIDDLQRAPLHLSETVDEVIKEHLQKLESYFAFKRYYDIRDPDSDQKIDPLLYLAEHPNIGLQCELAAVAVKKFLNTLGIKASVLSGEVPYFSEGGMYSDKWASRHAICVALLPSGSVLEIDFTPPITSQTPAKVRRFFDKKKPNSGEKYKTRFGKEKILQGRKAWMKSIVVSVLVGSIAAGIGFAELQGWIDLRKGGSHPSGEVGPDQVEESLNIQENDVEDESFTIDWENFPFDKVLAALGITAVGGAGIYKAYEKISYARRRREWGSYKTWIEEHFSPTEQVVMISVLYPMKKAGEINDKQLRRALKLLREFEMNAAQPMLELLAVLMNSGNEKFMPLFEEAIAESDYEKLYNLVAEESVTFRPKNELQQIWIKRLFMKRDPILEVIQERGKSIQKKKKAGDYQEIPIENGDRNYRLFCRGLGILELIQRIKTELEIDLVAAKMLKTLAGEEPNRGTTNNTIEVRSRATIAKNEIKSNLREFIYQIQRSIENGAVELFTTDELAKIVQEIKDI